MTRRTNAWTHRREGENSGLDVLIYEEQQKQTCMGAVTLHEHEFYCANPAAFHKCRPTVSQSLAHAYLEGKRN